MNDLAEQVFEQATMLQKRYMDGFKAGQDSIINKELLEALRHCVNELKRHKIMSMPYHEAEQVIAKAEKK